MVSIGLSSISYIQSAHACTVRKIVWYRKTATLITQRVFQIWDFQITFYGDISSQNDLDDLTEPNSIHLCQYFCRNVPLNVSFIVSGGNICTQRHRSYLLVSPGFLRKWNQKTKTIIYHKNILLISILFIKKINLIKTQRTYASTELYIHLFTNRLFKNNSQKTKDVKNDEKCEPRRLCWDVVHGSDVLT